MCFRMKPKAYTKNSCKMAQMQSHYLHTDNFGGKINWSLFEHCPVIFVCSYNNAKLQHAKNILFILFADMSGYIEHTPFFTKTLVVVAVGLSN